MKRLVFLILALPLFMLSCNENTRMAEQYHSFENTKWHRFNKVNFNLNVTDLNNDYDVKAIFTLTEQYLYDNLPIHVIMNTPNGEERINEHKMGFRDKEGTLLRGQKVDGKYLIEIPLFRNIRFKTMGECKIEVEQIIPKYDTFGIESFGVVIDKAAK
ncbi:MAG: hypothetical protein JEZ03_08645 [Bacteroidales bacterium]|nr:hypothetical protein [Bacteroidales bacterium]